MSRLSPAMASIGDGDITGCWASSGMERVPWRHGAHGDAHDITGCFGGSIGDGEGSLASPSTTNRPLRTHWRSKTANPAQHT
jgi:hypothetical protein